MVTFNHTDGRRKQPTVDTESIQSFFVTSGSFVLISGLTALCGAVDVCLQTLCCDSGPFLLIILQMLPRLRWSPAVFH